MTSNSSLKFLIVLEKIESTHQKLPGPAWMTGGEESSGNPVSIMKARKDKDWGSCEARMTMRLNF